MQTKPEYGTIDLPFQLTIYRWDQEYAENTLAPHIFSYSTYDPLSTDTRYLFGSGTYKIVIESEDYFSQYFQVFEFRPS